MRLTTSTPLRAPPPRACFPVAHAAASIDHVSVLTAVGLQGVIQATRDATSSSFPVLRDTLLPVVLTGLVYLGVSAWRQGSELRRNSAGETLTQRDFGLLASCLLVDLLGNGSFFIGDDSDLFWAPASAFIVNALFESPPLALLNFVKEALPLADVVPVATLAWLLAYAYPDAPATRALGLRRLRDGDGEDEFRGPM